MLIQQIRGNSSSAMARLHPQQQPPPNGPTVMKTSSGGVLPADNLALGGKMARSQFESMHNGPDDPLLFNEMPSIGEPFSKASVQARQQVLNSGNPQRRFKNNHDLNQSVDQPPRPRNELVRNNSSSRDKSAPNRAPITDVRKKQSATINVDDLPTPKLSDNTRGMSQPHTGSKQAPQTTTNISTSNQNNSDSLNLSLDRDIIVS